MKRPRGRPRIHPPKVPNGEDASITIANQDNQIRLLTERIVELTQLRDEYRRDRDVFKNSNDALLKENDALHGECAYSRGYIARVKETDSTGE
jgi:hypothetical protein